MYEIWKGDELPVSVMEGEVSLSRLVASAELLDRQASPFLPRKTTGKVQGYCLADSLYCAASIRTLLQRLGLVPVIDPNP